MGDADIVGCNPMAVELCGRLVLNVGKKRCCQSRVRHARDTALSGHSLDQARGKRIVSQRRTQCSGIG